MRNRTFNALMALLTMTLSAPIFAEGSHADHDHGDAETETAIGKPGLAAKVDRTIPVDMTDNMRYSPSDIQVKQGETIRFIVSNSGQIKHELSLGTEKELQEHMEVMKKFPDMVHDEPNSISLAPGKQGEIIWQFTRSGMVHFACLMPGHFEAGMKGAVSVVKN